MIDTNAQTLDEKDPQDKFLQRDLPVAYPSVPANSVKELIGLAKQKPGQLIFACSGAGSINHMSVVLFKMTADIDSKIVQFEGGGPATIDMLGGHSHAQLGSIPQVLPHIKSGKLRALGATVVKRDLRYQMMIFASR
jgi:tripartite-type tricarboxylate transporter receptor subunit TctC